MPDRSRSQSISTLCITGPLIFAFSIFAFSNFQQNNETMQNLDLSLSHTHTHAKFDLSIVRNRTRRSPPQFYLLCRTTTTQGETLIETCNRNKTKSRTAPPTVRIVALWSISPRTTAPACPGKPGHAYSPPPHPRRPRPQEEGSPFLLRTRTSRLRSSQTTSQTRAVAAGSAVRQLRGPSGRRPTPHSPPESPPHLGICWPPPRWPWPSRELDWALAKNSAPQELPRTAPSSWARRKRCSASSALSCSRSCAGWVVGADARRGPAPPRRRSCRTAGNFRLSAEPIFFRSFQRQSL